MRQRQTNPALLAIVTVIVLVIFALNVGGLLVYWRISATEAEVDFRRMETLAKEARIAMEGEEQAEQLKNAEVGGGASQ